MITNMPGLLARSGNFARWLAFQARRLAHWLRFTRLYLGKPPWDTNVSPPELVDFIASHPPGRAIDLGCGTGTNLLTLARAGWQVTGVEFVPRAANQARRKLRQAGAPGTVRTGDVASWQTVQGEYDLVLDIGCYHGLPAESRQRYCAHLPRLLPAGGSYLIYAHWLAPDHAGRIGLTPADLAAFQRALTLVRREDSQDRWGRQAVWMLFTRP